MALGRVQDRVNIVSNDDPNHPDLMTPVASAVQILADRLGFDLGEFMNRVDDTLEPGRSFQLFVTK